MMMGIEMAARPASMMGFRKLMRPTRRMTNHQRPMTNQWSSGWSGSFLPHVPADLRCDCQQILPGIGPLIDGQPFHDAIVAVGNRSYNLRIAEGFCASAARLVIVELWFSKTPLALGVRCL